MRVSSRLLVQAPWPESAQMGVPVWAQLPRLARAIQPGSMLALLAEAVAQTGLRTGASISRGTTVLTSASEGGACGTAPALERL